MKWIKTYESFITEADSSTITVEQFEELIDLPTGIGIITDVKWNEAKKSLNLTLENKLNSFDVGGTHNAIEKHKGDIKKRFPGIKEIQVGSTTINLK